jgi:multidrug efflux pump subunit AcrA (membrane-fusion protein)
VQHRSRWLIGLMVIAGLQLSACGNKPEQEPPEPARVEVNGSGLARVTLSEEGVRRIGLKTDSVRKVGDGKLEIPYAAILYEPNGDTYAFTESEPLTFVRRPITVASIAGKSAVLSDGPPPGTKVVTVGASELYGAETGVEE